ncbi:MAG: TlpA family protein disulfide reductase [Clostridiales bacterium]|nr:TlpA family protein disulfide reductase [Clostridiales bacterium]
MNKNFKGLLILVLVMIISFTISACSATVVNDTSSKENTVTTPSSTIAPVEDKNMAYNFTLLGIDGKYHSLSDYKGKKVYIKFWGTWCPACVSGLPELTKLHEEKLDSDTVILTLIAPSLSGEVSEERFIEWYEMQGYEFVVLLDPTAETFIEFGIRAFPTSAFITTDGQLFDVQIGHHSNESINETLDSMK